jgi:hypothetical protein
LQAALRKPPTVQVFASIEKNALSETEFSLLQRSSTVGQVRLFPSALAGIFVLKDANTLSLFGLLDKTINHRHPKLEGLTREESLRGPTCSEIPSKGLPAVTSPQRAYLQ